MSIYQQVRFSKISRLIEDAKERKRGERLELCLTEKGRKAALRHKIFQLVGVFGYW
ncbi:MAG: hypothetical protein U9P90_00525 [Patescibacteria group bacterium]|nr:hypothetical protein [Patescibacteria group bacterium]